MSGDEWIPDIGVLGNRNMQMELFDEMPVPPTCAHPNNPRWIGNCTMEIESYVEWEPEPDVVDFCGQRSATLEIPMEIGELERIMSLLAGSPSGDEARAFALKELTGE